MEKMTIGSLDRLKLLFNALTVKYRDSPEDIAFMEEVFQNLLDEPITTW